MTERLLLVDVTASDGDVEAEQVLVRASAEAVEFRTDDGTLITFDRRELTTILKEPSVGGPRTTDHSYAEHSRPT